MKMLLITKLFLPLLFQFLTQTESVTIEPEPVTIMCTQLRHGEYVIRNNIEYQELLKVRSPHPDCGSYELPPFDFENNLLIGIKTSVAGCGYPEVKTEYILQKDTLFITSNIKQIGMCKRGNPINIWSKIPLSKKIEYVRFKKNMTYDF
jgi:hypothetical protein